MAKVKYKILEEDHPIFNQVFVISSRNFPVKKLKETGKEVEKDAKQRK